MYYKEKGKDTDYSLEAKVLWICFIKKKLRTS